MVSAKVRFVLWLVLFLIAISAAHALAVMTGGGSVNLKDALVASALGYWVGWVSHAAPPAGHSDA
jgi:hypothetical protein